MNIQKKNRNASSSAFGWDFQFHAGIMLMLNFITHASDVKIEGETEDIEITLDNNTKIFAQAKSSVQPIECKDAKAKFASALETLSEAAKKENVASLIYVTNIPNPINVKESISLFSYAPIVRPCISLPDRCKTQIKHILTSKNISIPLEKLSIFVFSFYGDGDVRYAHVKQKIITFLASLDESLCGMMQRVLERWELDFGKNASQRDRSIKISKKDMIWPLIVWICENRAHKSLDELDAADKEEVLKHYNSVIKTNSERFDLFTKVMESYDEFTKQKRGKSKEITELFIASESEKFREEFNFFKAPKDIEALVLKLTIERIIESRHTVSKVKDELGI